MSTTLRRVLFYFFILIFLVFGAYLLVTAQGLTFDFQNFQFVKTGALFLKFNPSDASLLLDGKPKEISRGLVIPGVLVTDLRPGAYHLMLQKEGYETWEKNLEIKSGLVTAATHVELWPATSTFKNVLEDPVSDFWMTNKGVVLLYPDHTLHFDGVTLRGNTVVTSDENSNLVITKSGATYFLTDLENPEITTNLSSIFSSLQTNTFNLAKAEAIQTVLFHPFSGSKLLIATPQNLFSFDMKRVRLEKLLSASSTVSATTSDNEALLLDKKGDLSIFNLLLQTTNKHPLSLTRAEKMTASPSGDIVFFSDRNGDLLQYNRGSRATSTIAGNVTSYFLSPSEERMALIKDDGSLVLYALKDYHSDIDITKGTYWNIALPKNAVPESFFWVSDFPNYGLVTTTHGVLFVVELDSRTPANVHQITEAIKKTVSSGTILYLLKDDGTFVETTLGE